MVVKALNYINAAKDLSQEQNSYDIYAYKDLRIVALFDGQTGQTWEVLNEEDVKLIDEQK